jgi:GNAT superfamily N-acetyltransferase
MFVLPSQRNKGVASLVLNALENWAKELHYPKCILETSTKQPDAIALYTKNAYKIIPNYAPYENVAVSVCFEKIL